MENKNRPYRQWILSVLSSVAAALLLELIHWLSTPSNDQKSLIKEVFEGSFTNLNFWLYVLVFFCLLFYPLFQFYKSARQVGRRVSFLRLKTLYNMALRHRRMIYEIHEFQHEYDQVLRIIGKEGSPSMSELRRLLRKIKETFEEFTGAHISVNIRIYAIEQSDNSSKAISTSRTYLETLERVPSKKERETSRKYDNGRERTFEERFYLGKLRYKKDDDLKEWVEKEVKHQDNLLKRSKENYKVNSAYNYVLGNDKSYFISNNLEEDTKAGFYYSSSSEYQKYYNSLAIVRIGPYFKNRIPNDPLNTTNGLLIIDSLETGIFDYAFTRQLLGYYAHRLHPVVEFYKKVNFGNE